MRKYDGESEVVGIIEKNQSQEVCICLCRSNGRTYVDIRTYVDMPVLAAANDNNERQPTKKNDINERQPTKKGVHLKAERLPDLVDALQSAERKWRGQPD